MTISEAMLKKRDKDSFDAGFEAGAGIQKINEEMLAALTRLDHMWSIEGGYEHPDTKIAKRTFAPDTIAVWKQIRAAIAKAEGRQ